MLVPLPLFVSRPWLGEPGMLVVAVDPMFPVTTPVPREVETGAPTLGDDDEVCATATPVIVARTIAAANQALIMSWPPGTVS